MKLLLIGIDVLVHERSQPLLQFARFVSELQNHFYLPHRNLRSSGVVSCSTALNENICKRPSRNRKVVYDELYNTPASCLTRVPVSPRARPVNTPVGVADVDTNMFARGGRRPIF